MWFGFSCCEGKVQVTRFHVTFLSFQHQIVIGVPFKSPFKLITIHKYYNSLSLSWFSFPHIKCNFFNVHELKKNAYPYIIRYKQGAIFFNIKIYWGKIYFNGIVNKK